MGLKIRYVMENRIVKTTDIGKVFHSLWKENIQDHDMILQKNISG